MSCSCNSTNYILVEISAKLIETSSKTGYNIGEWWVFFDHHLHVVTSDMLFSTIAEDYVKKTKAKVNARGDDEHNYIQINLYM